MFQNTIHNLEGFIMHPFLRFIIMIMCLLLALGCYFVGVPAGGLGFLILGLVFEGGFWLSAFGRRRKNKATDK